MSEREGERAAVGGDRWGRPLLGGAVTEGSAVGGGGGRPLSAAGLRGGGGVVPRVLSPPGGLAGGCLAAEAEGRRRKCWGRGWGQR